MYCEKCGTLINDYDNACYKCGAFTNKKADIVQQTQNQNNTQQPGYGFAIASLVLGILSFLGLSYGTNILAIVFGVMAKNKGCQDGIATAGIVIGIINILVSTIAIVVVLAVLQSFIFWI